MDSEQKREHFRIVYPVGQHGKILIKKSEYDVLDISQKGVRFAVDQRALQHDWQIGTVVRGSISFLNGNRVIVSGKVLRTVEDHSVVLHLDEPIDLKFMYDEHRFVIQKFYVD